MDKEKASKLLHDVKMILEAMGLEYFLIDGTLLGAIREGDFIAHDLDMDIGVFAEEWTKDKLTLFEQACYQEEISIGHAFGELDKYFEIAVKRDDIKLDLFFYRREGDRRIFHAFKNGGRNLPEDVITYEYPAWLIEELAPINFQNELYLAPANAIEVLICKYGVDWKIPVTEWDWKYGPHNVRK